MGSGWWRSVTMAFDFPQAPTNGQVYTPSPEVKYTFDGISWIGEFVLQPALVGGPIGGVIALERSLNNGLEHDTRGVITAPRATHEHAGTIVEPEQPSIAHSRFRDPVTGINKWVPAASGIITSATAPNDPLPDTLWFNTTNGITYVFYADNTSGEGCWVQL
jgi:hypothetical protein